MTKAAGRAFRDIVPKSFRLTMPLQLQLQAKQRLPTVLQALWNKQMQGQLPLSYCVCAPLNPTNLNPPLHDQLREFHLIVTILLLLSS
jgi:hypothetical protein